MTSRSYTEVTCPCWHVGTIVKAENDQLFSKQWESYSLHDLTGGSFQTNGFAHWPEVFAQCKPTCPKCCMLLTPDHITKG